MDSGREKMARQDCCLACAMAKDERFLFSSMVATTAKIAILTSYYGEKSLRAVVKGGKGKRLKIIVVWRMILFF